MAEVVGDMLPVGEGTQTKVTHFMLALHAVAGKQLNSLVNDQAVPGNDHLGMVCQFLVQAQILGLAGIEGAEGVLVDIDGGGMVDLQKALQSAAVVIVAVGDDHQIHLFQIHAHLPGIVQKVPGHAGIKEDLVALGFNIHTQSGLSFQTGAAGGILN